MDPSQESYCVIAEPLFTCPKTKTLMSHSLIVLCQLLLLQPMLFTGQIIELPFSKLNALLSYLKKYDHSYAA